MIFYNMGVFVNNWAALFLNSYSGIFKYLSMLQVEYFACSLFFNNKAIVILTISFIREW